MKRLCCRNLKKHLEYMTKKRRGLKGVTQFQNSNHGSRYISTDTLKEILRELDSKLTEEELDGIIEEVDTDGSGTLDFDGRLEIIKNP